MVRQATIVVLSIVALPGVVSALYADTQLLGYFITNNHGIRWPLDSVFVPQEVIGFEIRMAILVFSLFFLQYLFIFYRSFHRLSYPAKMFTSLLLCVQVALLLPIARYLIVGITIL